MSRRVAGSGCRGWLTRPLSLSPQGLPPCARSIPGRELRLLCRFLEGVYAARGWRAGVSLHQRAWDGLLQAATSEAGGAWQLQFAGADLTDEAVAKLGHLIDAVFFGGQLHSRMLHRPNRRQLVHSAGWDQAQQPPATAAAGPATPPAVAGQAHAEPCPAHQLRYCVMDEPQAAYLACFDERNVVFVNRPRWRHDLSAEQPMNCEGMVVSSRLQVRGS